MRLTRTSDGTDSSVTEWKRRERGKWTSDIRSFLVTCSLKLVSSVLYHPVFALLSLAPGGVCPASSVTRTAVRSYRTFSPLPYRGLSAPVRRFVFCGTFPTLASGGRYPPPCPVEPGLSSMRISPHSDRLAHSERETDHTFSRSERIGDRMSPDFVAH